jgi:dethiobiotin synthetase
MNFFVTAIHTDSGKTLVSSILCEAFNADYWKPVQAGTPTDRETVRSLITNPRTVLHPETYLLEKPESPHAASARQGITIDLAKISIPETKNKIIVEGAGGCLVPLNNNDMVIDIPAKLGLPVVLVSNFYLGSINHTLLTCEAIRNRGIRIEGIIFNGIRNNESEQSILRYTGLRTLLHIEQEPSVTTETVIKYANRLRENWDGRSHGF